jgi:hypothetical protein
MNNNLGALRPSLFVAGDQSPPGLAGFVFLLHTCSMKCGE